ncbi:hypothetical protein ACWEKT_11610 [Nocardia takedensis]
MVPLPISVAPVTAAVVRNRGRCGDFAKVVAEFGPPGSGGVTEILCAVSEDRLPAEFLPPLTAGITEGLDGVAASVLIVGAVSHDTDSSDRAFRLAGWEAARAALIASGLVPESAAAELRWVDWPGRPRPKQPKRRKRGIPRSSGAS